MTDRHVIRRALVGLTATFVLCAAAPAVAETPKEQAEALFQKAMRDLQEGRTDLACQELEDARRLDGGGGTILALALCHEQQGRGATAMQELQDALAVAIRAKREERMDLAEQHLKDLEATVSRITVVTARAEVEGLAIELDGVALDPKRWNEAIPVDAGAHVVRALAPGQTPWQTTVHVQARGDRPRVEVPAWPAPHVERRTATVAPAPPPAGTDGRRLAGFVVGGVGLVAIGVGSYFGVRAIQKRDDAVSLCGGTTCHDYAGITLDDQSRDAGLVSTIAIGAGLAAVATGTFLVLTAKKTAPAGAQVQAAAMPGGGALFLRGTF